MVKAKVAPFVECVPVLKGRRVIPRTNSLGRLFHGVFLILAIGITTGQGSMEGWSGMASSQQQLLTRSPWGSRYMYRGGYNYTHALQY